MLCREISLVKEGEGWGCAIPLYCRSWGCDECRPRRASKLIREGQDGAPERLITLTSSKASGETPNARATAIAQAWRCVVRRIRARWRTRSVSYLAVFERTKKGEPHLHILFRGPFVPQRWLSLEMNRLIRAPIVDVRKIRHPARCARYIAKYIGKDPYRFGTCKRYWATPNWNTAPEPDDDPEFRSVHWERDDRSWSSIVHAWMMLGRKPQHTKFSRMAIWGRAPPSLAKRLVPPSGAMP